MMQRHLEQHGIEFALGDSAARFEDGKAYMQSGKTIDFDVLVLAVGVRPNSGLIREIGGEILISSDAHRPEDLDRGFDIGFGTQFSTYAVPKIAGEIRRFLRDDGAVKVSRGVKENARRIRLARGELEQTLGREPTLSELAASTGFTPEEIAVTETATSRS